MDNVALIELTMKERGINRAALARHTGIDYSLIGRYLTRKIAVGLKNAPRLAAALGLTQADVLFGRPVTDEAA
jgi:transcriptional regulator with XRE-family HTH domain